MKPMRKRSRDEEAVTESRGWWEAVQWLSWMGFRGWPEITVGVGGNRARYQCGMYISEAIRTWEEVDVILLCVNLSGTAIIIQFITVSDICLGRFFVCISRAGSVIMLASCRHEGRHDDASGEQREWGKQSFPKLLIGADKYKWAMKFRMEE